jgi:AmmeMemoRadiSam system protein A
VSQTGSRTSGVAVQSALTAEDKAVLLDAALTAIETTLATGRRPGVDVDQLPERLRSPGASFVTLRHGPELLGCIGTLEAYQPLGLDVVEHSLGAAFADPRFHALGPDELEDLTVEVSVLGPLKWLRATSFDDLRAQLRPGVDGLLVAVDGHRATFLPSVWPNVRDVDDFLDLLWRKAGLTPGEWPVGLEVATYRVDHFERTRSGRPAA